MEAYLKKFQENMHILCISDFNISIITLNNIILFSFHWCWRLSFKVEQVAVDFESIQQLASLVILWNILTSIE